MTEQFAVVRRLRPAVYLVHRYRQINQNDNGYFLANLSFLSLAGYNGSMFFSLITLLLTQIFYGAMNAKFALPNLSFIFSVILLGPNIVSFLKH
jgi:hypothetical protein